MDSAWTLPPRYQGAAIVAQGGMGCLLRATDTRTGATVAVKIMAPTGPVERFAEFRSRFVREARILAQLSHPYIVTVLDVADDGPNPFLVMEWVEGVTLSSYIAGLSTADLEAHLHIVLDICDATDHAHQRGVIHRDIKPGNVMILSNGGIKLLDFGLAKLTSTDQTNLTQIGDLLGTPNYMAPEQLQGTACDHRADIYSLGCILYELITLKRPFGEGNWFRKVLADPDPPSSINPQVSKNLDRTVLTAMARQREDRYPSALEFKQALSACLREHTAAFGGARAGRDWKESFKRGLERLTSWVPVRSQAVELAQGVVRDVVRLGLVLTANSTTPPDEGDDPIPFAVDRVLCVLAQEIRQCGGDVSRFDPSGLVAFFGSHATSERDCDSAVSAGLAMLGKIARANRHLAAQGVNLSAAVTVDLARVGVAIDGGLDDHAFEVTRVPAPPPGLWVTGAVRERIRDRFHMSAPEETTGLSCLGAPIASSPAAGPELFLGRSAELRSLSSIWRRLVEPPDGPAPGGPEPGGAEPATVVGVRPEGRARIVLLTGEAGIGKSSLANRFLGQIGATGLRGAARIAPSPPFSLVADLLRDLLKLRESDDAVAVHRSIQETLSRLSPSMASSERARTTALLGHLLGFQNLGEAGGEQSLAATSDSPEGLRDAIVHTVAEVLSSEARIVALADERPLVVLLDDLQWIDDMSLELVETFLSRVPVPVLVIACTRPPYQPPDRWRRLGTVTTLEIGSLDEAAAAALFRSSRVAAVEGGKPASEPEVEQQVLSLCGGHPLFLEEMSNLLAGSDEPLARARRLAVPEPGPAGEGGASGSDRGLEMPAALRTIVAARLDALTSRERELLQLGSVLGEEFDLAVLREVCDELWPGTADEIPGVVDRLRDLKFLAGTGEPDDPCRFRQSLVRTVVYSTILPANRRLLHELAGRALERRSIRSRETIVESLAHHAREAANRPQELVYAREALVGAAARHDHEAVFRLAEHILDEPRAAPAGSDEEAQPPDESPVGRPASQDELATVFDVLSVRERAYHARGQIEEQRRDLDEMLDLATRLRDLDRQAEALLRLSQFHCWQAGDFVWAQGCATRAFKLARQLKNPLREAEALTSLACSQALIGRFDEAIASHGRALSLYRQEGRSEGIASSLCHLASSHGEVWRVSEALDLGRQALDLDRRNGDHRSIARDLRTLAKLHRTVGETESSLSLADEALECDTAIGYQQGQASDLLGIGQTLRAMDRFDQAVARLRDALELLGRPGGEALAVAVRVELAGCLLDLGDAGMLDECERHSQVAAAAAQGLRRAGLQAMATLQLARHRLVIGPGTEALALIEKALALVADRDVPGADLVEILFHYGTVLGVLGQTAPARAVFDRCASIVHERTQKLGHETLQESFLGNVALHRRVLAAVLGARG